MSELALSRHNPQTLHDGTLIDEAQRYESNRAPSTSNAKGSERLDPDL